MTSFNNVALFIKRAEEYQTKEFIINAFSVNNIGKVRDVKFIKKHNDNSGKNYNGVIVIFERWNINGLVQSLFDQMSDSKDGTTRFYFDNTHYWIINVHRQKLPECEELITVDTSLPDKERIKQLEDLVKSMASQMYYMSTRQERSERLMMEYEHKDMQHHLYNMELKFQLEDKDIEKKWAEDDFKEEIEKLKAENEKLNYRLALSSIDIVRKECEIEQLRQEVRDQSCILSYVENQSKEMQNMLNKVAITDPIKPIIDKYINENLY